MARARAESKQSSFSPSSKKDSEVRGDNPGSTSSTRGQGPLRTAAPAVGLDAGARSTLDGLSIQPKLTVNEPDDKYEREAERVADAVIRKAAPESEPDDQITARPSRTGTSDGEIGGESVRAIESMRGGGRPLPKSIRSFFEPRFAREFGDVRVHTGSVADRFARSLNARALTSGKDVVFRDRSYDPGSQEGKRLIAHELTHVIQQEADPFNALRRGGRQGCTIQRQHMPVPIGGGGGGDRAKAERRDGVPPREQEKGGPGLTTRAVGDVSVRAGTTMTAEAALREIYDEAAREISKEALRMVETGEKSIEEAAQWATKARNQLKVKIRASGSPITRGLAEARNLRKYGNKVGPTYDDLIRNGKTPKDIIGKAGEANRKVTKAATRMRLLGRLTIAIDVVIVTWEVASAPEGKKLKTATAGAGGVAGALVGGWAGAEAGAWAGGGIGGAVGGPVGASVGATVGGLIGGVGGAVAGGMSGRKAGEAAYEYAEDLFTPNLDDQMKEIDKREDRYIREKAGN